MRIERHLRVDPLECQLVEQWGHIFRRVFLREVKRIEIKSQTRKKIKTKRCFSYNATEFACVARRKAFGKGRNDEIKDGHSVIEVEEIQIGSIRLGALLI